MCLAVTLLSTMNAMAKFLTAEYPLIQIVWARFTGHFVAMVILFWPKYGRRLFQSRRYGLQLGRSAVMFISNTVFIAGLPLLHLATASAIMFTAPLMVAALSVPLLGERVGPRRWGAVLVGFAGILIVVRPGGDVANFGAILIGISAICFALYQIMTRIVVAEDAPETTIVYTAIVATIAMSFALPFDYRVPNNLLDVTLSIGLGVLGGLGQYFIIKALQYGPASAVSPFYYGDILIAATLGYLILGLTQITTIDFV
jgi:drug/metabolite transporter (DMT)-like permease